MVRTRPFQVALLVGLLAVLMAAAPALAVQKGVSKTNVWGSIGIWGSYANFFARWNIVQMHSEGITEWDVDSFDMDGLLVNGKSCNPVVCGTFSFTAQATFKTAAGSTVKTIYPPAGNCYSSAYSGNDLAWSTCQRGLFIVPISATQVTLTWRIWRTAPNGYVTNPWSATVTTPIS